MTRKNEYDNTREGIGEEDGDAQESLNVPSAFICPLTLQIFEDPVLDPASGHSFSRGAIMEWLIRQEFRGNQTNPLTRRPLRCRDLIPNRKLRTQISQWKAQNNIYDEPEKDSKSIPTPWYRQRPKGPPEAKGQTSQSSNDALGGDAFVRRLLEAQRRDAEFRRKFILGSPSRGSAGGRMDFEYNFGREFR